MKYSPHSAVVKATGLTPQISKQGIKAEGLSIYNVGLKCFNQ